MAAGAILDTMQRWILRSRRGGRLDDSRRGHFWTSRRKLAAAISAILSVAVVGLAFLLSRTGTLPRSEWARRANAICKAQSSNLRIGWTLLVPSAEREDALRNLAIGYDDVLTDLRILPIREKDRESIVRVIAFWQRGVQRLYQAADAYARSDDSYVASLHQAQQFFLVAGEVAKSVGAAQCDLSS